MDKPDLSNLSIGELHALRAVLTAAIMAKRAINAVPGASAEIMVEDGGASLVISADGRAWDTMFDGVCGHPEGGRDV